MKFTRKIYGSPFANQHIAEITGQHTHYRPTAWVRGKEKYSHITGGIALPTLEHPGYILTAGVRYDTPGHLVCIDELQHDDEYALIERAQELQTEYGPGVIETWWGDPERLMSILSETYQGDNPLRISAPVDSDRTDSFQIYFSRLYLATSERNKTIFFYGCDHLRNSLHSFIKDKGQKQEKNPALWVAGALIHTILMIRPWEQALERTELIPTTFEDQAAYEHERAMKEIEQELYGEIA